MPMPRVYSWRFRFNWFSGPAWAWTFWRDLQVFSSLSRLFHLRWFLLESVKTGQFSGWIAGLRGWNKPPPPQPVTNNWPTPEHCVDIQLACLKLRSDSKFILIPCLGIFTPVAVGLGSLSHEGKQTVFCSSKPITVSCLFGSLPAS